MALPSSHAQCCANLPSSLPSAPSERRCPPSGEGLSQPPTLRAPGSEREAPALLGPMEGSSQNQPSPGLAAPAVHSAAAAGLPPTGHPAPPPPQPACQEADGWAHVHCSCGARQHRAWLQGQSLVTTKQGKRGWPPRASGHPSGCRLSWPALHLTRPPQGRRCHQHAWKGASDANLGHGPQGLS